MSLTSWRFTCGDCGYGAQAYSRKWVEAAAEAHLLRVGHVIQIEAVPLAGEPVDLNRPPRSRRCSSRR